MSEAIVNPISAACPHCEKNVQVWFDKPAPGSLVQRVQAVSHAFPTCDGFRSDDDTARWAPLAGAPAAAEEIAPS